MGICPVIYLWPDHEETIANDETGEDVKTATLLQCTEMSDLVTLRICPVKSFNHADLSNEETIENDENWEDDKLATTEASETEK